MKILYRIFYYLTTTPSQRLTHRIQDRAAADLQQVFGTDVTR